MPMGNEDGCASFSWSRRPRSRSHLELRRHDSRGMPSPEASVTWAQAFWRISAAPAPPGFGADTTFAEEGGECPRCRPSPISSLPFFRKEASLSDGSNGMSSTLRQWSDKTYIKSWLSPGRGLPENLERSQSVQDSKFILGNARTLVTEFYFARFYFSAAIISRQKAGRSSGVRVK